MTEEERLAYIAKHPIVPTEKPLLPTFVNVTPEKYKQAAANTKRTKRMTQGTSVLDRVDKAEIHKRYMDGEIIEDIAAALKIPLGTLNYCIGKFRELEPERWPRRQIRRNSPERR